jgi:hypothetical protein
MPTEQQPSMTPAQPEPPKQVPPVVDEPVPSIWPGAFGAYKHSKAAVLYNISTFLGLIGLSILVSIASGLVSGDRSISIDGGNSFHASGPSSLIDIITQLVSIWLSAAIAYLMVASVKRQKVAVGDSLREGGNVFLPFLGLSLLLGLIAVASILLLIIPAFFIIPRLVLAQYYLIEGKLSITQSIAASWNATRGNVGKVWGIFGFNVLLVLLALTFVGIPFAVYFGIMYQAVAAVLYLYLKKQPSAVAPVALAAPSGPIPPQS